MTEQGGAVVIAFAGRSVSVASDWVPGEPVWHGTLDGVKVAAQVRPILNGVALGHAGAYANAHVYTLSLIHILSAQHPPPSPTS